LRQIIVAAAAAFVIGGAATGAVLSQAQPAPPMPVAPAGQADGAPQWGHGPHHGPMGMHGPMGFRTFALVYPQADRQLTPADVQKIAEAFLLWNGNHSWKVTNVIPGPDGVIGFNIATAEGSVVAKFAMDPHTGRLTRVS
jgi:hypothetical protein